MQGDSGSPLMLEISKNKFMVAGIASYTEHIEDEFLSGVFVTADNFFYYTIACAIASAFVGWLVLV